MVCTLADQTPGWPQAGLSPPCLVWLQCLQSKNLRDLIAATDLVILLKLDSNHWFFILHDLEITWMTSKNNRAPLLGNIKLCALFPSHPWFPTRVKIRKRSIQVKIVDFLSAVTLKFERWPWKIGHLFYASSNFVRHLIAIGPIKWSYGPDMPNSGLKHCFFPRVTLKFGGWPWKTKGHLPYASSSFLHDSIAICEFTLELFWLFHWI